MAVNTKFLVRYGQVVTESPLRKRIALPPAITRRGGASDVKDPGAKELV
jgi:hypothetical protein